MIVIVLRGYSRRPDSVLTCTPELWLLTPCCSGVAPFPKCHVIRITPRDGALSHWLLSLRDVRLRPIRVCRGWMISWYHWTHTVGWRGHILCTSPPAEGHLVCLQRSVVGTKLCRPRVLPGWWVGVDFQTAAQHREQLAG